MGRGGKGPDFIQRTVGSHWKVLGRRNVILICWKDHSGCSVENGSDGTGLEASRAVLEAVSGDKTMACVEGTSVVPVGIESTYGARKKESRAVVLGQLGGLYGRKR